MNSVDKALYKFQSHPSILKVKERVKGNKFRFSNLTQDDLIREINKLNLTKANMSNNIPVKYLKDNIDISGNVLLKMINNEITKSHFPDKLKLAEISPLQKDSDVMNKTKYRPISILPSISKIYERIMQSQLAKFIENHLYIHMCKYRKGHSTQFALLTLVEKWKKILDNHGYAGAIITDRSKAFDTMNHELLIAKLHVYGFGRSALMLINSYLKNRWHTTKINSAYSTWKELIVGVPQGSVLGPLLFNIYFNDLFFILEETESINYADDNNLYACDMDLSNLISKLESGALIVIECF